VRERVLRGQAPKKRKQKKKSGQLNGMKDSAACAQLVLFCWRARGSGFFEAEPLKNTNKKMWCELNDMKD